MKLRNKKTGGLADIDELCVHTDAGFHDYYSLAELNEEWEDYEEPKEYWYYDTTKNGVDKIKHLEDKEKDQAIGNYFETKEEAEKAVEKLKAWKRLKDKGFRFTGINDDEDSQELITQCGILCEVDIYHLAKDKDFLLLFGGEE